MDNFWPIMIILKLAQGNEWWIFLLLQQIRIRAHVDGSEKRQLILVNKCS